METTIITALIGLGTLMALNLAGVAYSYGKLNQKVSDICRRLTNLEKTQRDRSE